MGPPGGRAAPISAIHDAYDQLKADHDALVIDHQRLRIRLHEVEHERDVRGVLLYRIHLAACHVPTRQQQAALAEIASMSRFYGAQGQFVPGGGCAGPDGAPACALRGMPSPSASSGS